MESLLRVRGALSCSVTELGQAAPQVLLPLSSNGFRGLLQTAAWTIWPFAEANFVLERHCTTLADGFCVYGSIYQHLAGSKAGLGEYQLTADLERRWAQEEKTLFLLAFCLHPYHMQVSRVLLPLDWRGAPASLMSLPCLANAKAGYFSKWFPDKADRANQIVQQTFVFLTDDPTSQSCALPLAEGQTHYSAGWTWHKYWSFMEMSGTCAEVSKLALVLLGCKP